jgi:hypothetical protein
MEETKPTEGEIVGQDRPVTPTKHPEDTVKLLENAFNNMFNITEACHYAGIHRDTYYAWLADDDIFSYRMSIAQQAPNMKAKQNILMALNAGDTGISKWYLERRDPGFKAKTEISPGEGFEREESKLKDFMEDRDDGAYDDAHTADDERQQPTAETDTEGGEEVATGPSDIS